MGDGIKLGIWLSNQRQAHRTGKLPPDRLSKLMSMKGFINTEYLPRGEHWEKNYKLLKEYFDKHGNAAVPFRFVTDDGVNLGYWLNDQRKAHRRSSLNAARVKKLMAIEGCISADVEPVVEDQVVSDETR